jgi:hypothetical protein
MVEALSKYKIKKFSSCKSHTLLLAKKLSKSGKEQDQTVMFSMGKVVNQSDFTFNGVNKQ